MANWGVVRSGSSPNMVQQKERELVTFMTRQQLDKPDEAIICDCDKYGHAHSPPGEIEPFGIMIELQCVKEPSADRFGHVCRREVEVAQVGRSSA
jgi:hypothetical protein